MWSLTKPQVGRQQTALTATLGRTHSSYSCPDRIACKLEWQESNLPTHLRPLPSLQWEETSLPRVVTTTTIPSLLPCQESFPSSNRQESSLLAIFYLHFLPGRRAFLRQITRSGANTYTILYSHFALAGGLSFYQSSRMDSFSPYQPSSPPWLKDFPSTNHLQWDLSALTYPHFYPCRSVFLLPIVRSGSSSHFPPSRPPWKMVFLSLLQISRSGHLLYLPIPSYPYFIPAGGLSATG
jgi:hypothetical protein